VRVPQVHAQDGAGGTVISLEVSRRLDPSRRLRVKNLESGGIAVRGPTAQHDMRGRVAHLVLRSLIQDIMIPRNEAHSTFKRGEDKICRRQLNGNLASLSLALAAQLGGGRSSLRDCDSHIATRGSILRQYLSKPRKPYPSLGSKEGAIVELSLSASEL
jgi:hypothetical protein